MTRRKSLGLMASARIGSGCGRLTGDMGGRRWRRRGLRCWIGRGRRARRWGFAASRAGRARRRVTRRRPLSRAFLVLPLSTITLQLSVLSITIHELVYVVSCLINSGRFLQNRRSPSHDFRDKYVVPVGTLRDAGRGPRGDHVDGI